MLLNVFIIFKGEMKKVTFAEIFLDQIWICLVVFMMLSYKISDVLNITDC